MEIGVTIDYAPRPQFRAYHERTQRWSIIVAHRRAGKTVATLNDIIRRALLCELPNPRYGYIAPYYVQAKDIAWGYLKYFCSPLLAYGGAVNESELRVTLPNSATIRLYGADNADRMRGLYFDGVALDEPADMSPRVWGEVVRPTLSDRKGWATFIGTPKGHNDFYRIWQQAQNDPEWFALRLRASETEILPADELASVRKDLSDDQYEQEYETSFEAAIQGAILGRYLTAAEAEGRIGSAPYDKEGAEVWISSDIGFHDTSSWWFWQPQFGGFSLIDYDDDSGLDATEWANRLAKRCDDNGYKLGGIYLPHDARAKTFAAKDTAQEQFWRVFGVEKVHIVPQTSKADRINAARRIIGRCRFDARCNDGIEALKQWRFKWDEDRKEFSKEPEHDWASHPGDAYSYGAQMLEERTTKPEDVPPRWLSQQPTFNEILERARRKRLEAEA